MGRREYWHVLLLITVGLRVVIYAQPYTQTNLLSLSNGAWESVKQKSVLTHGFVQILVDHVDNHLIRDELASGHRLCENVQLLKRTDNIRNILAAYLLYIYVYSTCRLIIFSMLRKIKYNLS